MEHVYPPGPAAMPENLTAATSAYKRHAWLAMLGLTAFIVLYFALSTWFAWTSWRLFHGMYLSGNFELPGFIAGICAAFLAVFMLKALFFIQHRYQIEDLEITRAEEPRLFEFIDRLADEARAPRAHKVYLSPRVNAAVFYDLSLLNLFIPSKKNLEIGLGLVNVLSLGELKAVLAHEFGHFAQKSMAVGRWVYIAQQIAGHVVARRDALDRLLRGLSRVDIRVAWIGWVLSIIVWSIRSMMDVLFRAVLIAQRALSRQMEFQADLVAVSLTGSDALIHALHQLNAADDAWDKTLSFANEEAVRKRAVSDLFAVHTRIIERMREILNQPTYGVVPPVPADSPDSHRVFKTAIAQPPRMWLTHPPSADREANAKRRYVAAPVDARSAWSLFQDPQALKDRMSAHVFREAKTEPVPMEKTLEQLGKEYGRAFLDRKYRGVYLGRSPVRHVKTPGELYATQTASPDLIRSLDELYPESLANDVEELTETLEQKASLEALRDQVAQAPGGVIRHNGEELRRAQLPEVIAKLTRKADMVRARIETHDRDCRTAHLHAARQLGKGWPEYLTGLASVLHYADHLSANIRDAQGHLANVYNVVTADGRVSSDEMSRLVGACQELYRPIEQMYSHRTLLTLDRTLLRRLETESWPAMLEEFKLGAPAHDNLSKWLNVVDSWINASTFALSRLRVAALEQLLLAEQQAAKFVREGKPAADAPPASSVPAEYATLVPGTERPRQTKLDWWDRFHAADGIVPMVARSAVAVGIVGGVVFLGAKIGTAVLTIYNPLATPIVVEVAGDRVSASPGQAVTIDVPPSGALTLRALGPNDAVIETFEETLDGTNTHYVYNVAGAAPLFEWTAVYSEAGNSPPTDEHPMGAPRWTRTAADHVFEEPPTQIKLSSSSAYGTRRVLTAETRSPSALLDLVQNEQDRDRMVLTHARWDETRSAEFLEWLTIASTRPDFDALLKTRLDAAPKDVALRRFQQDFTVGEKHAAACAEMTAAAAAEPTDADLQYLAIRCADTDLRTQSDRFLAAHKKWPENPWLRFATGISLADSGNYGEALTLIENSRLHLPMLKDYLTMNVARLRRLAVTEGRNLSDLTRDSRQLQLYLAIEDGSQVANTPLEPYALMARGDLAAAFEKAQQAGDGNGRLLRLIAGSDGATPAMVKAAFAAPLEQDADLTTVFVLYGIAAREHRDLAPYVAVLGKANDRQTKSVMVFLDRLQHGVDPQQALADLEMIDLAGRLSALNTAVLMLGDKAPASWRADVLHGLFVGERPYLVERRKPQTVSPARLPENSARIIAPAT